MSSDRAKVARFATLLEGLEPQDVLRWAVRRYGNRLVLSSSFGGPTSMVVLDMLMQIDRSVPVSIVDTGVLFSETHDLVDRVQRRYGIRVETVRSEISLPEQERRYGSVLWERDPDACCGLRKVVPQRTFLSGFDAWITGLRRDQGATRSSTSVVAWDDRFELVKIGPLVAWDEERVWRYIRSREVPYNLLNDRGFPSVGCTYCTRPIADGEDRRAGRWAGFAKIECGLHAEFREAES